MLNIGHFHWEFIADPAKGAETTNKINQSIILDSLKFFFSHPDSII